MPTTAVRPTTTHRVRGFLAQHQIALEPWSGLDETYAALYRLLAARRGDAAFWPPLRRLIGELVADAADGPGARRLPAAGAELLRSWDLEELVRDLEAALPEAGADGGRGLPAVRRFLARLTAPALGGFLLLGLTAARCEDGGADTGADADADSDTDADSDADADTDSDCAESMDACALDHASILWTALDESTAIPQEDKPCLCSCFAALNDSWTAGLTALFQSATPAQTAAYLEEMIACCAGGTPSDEFPQEFTDDYCSAAIYKGVAFPS